MLFAALHMSAFGTKRTCRNGLRIVRSREQSGHLGIVASVLNPTLIVAEDAETGEDITGDILDLLIPPHLRVRDRAGYAH
jgi:hypothetical protein